MSKAAFRAVSFIFVWDTKMNKKDQAEKPRADTALRFAARDSTRSRSSLRQNPLRSLRVGRRPGARGFKAEAATPWIPAHELYKP